MSVFDLFTLFGGLALFLYGMSVMGNSLEKLAGSRLKAVLGSMTSNVFKGFLLGLGVTAIIQSSSATTVMVVGFVNSGLMTLRQATGVIMGANLGTSVTSWLLSTTGITGDGASTILNLFKPATFTPILAFAGMLLFCFSKNRGGRTSAASSLALQSSCSAWSSCRRLFPGLAMSRHSRTL